MTILRIRARPRAAPVVLLALFAAAGCGSSTALGPGSSPHATESPEPSASALPSPTGTPSPAPSLNVTPLIPELTSGGMLVLAGEDGTVSATFPASTSLQLFSAFGDAFLGARQAGGTDTALVAIQPGGALTTLQTISDPATFVDATGAVDGHAWASLVGTPYAPSPCNSGMGKGVLAVRSAAAPSHVIAQLPSGGPSSAWQLGGWVGDDIWVEQTTGCPFTQGGRTAAYIAHENGTALIPVQQQLGTGCALAAVALDGSMLCATQPATQSATTWRFVGADGTVRDFNTASLGTLCAGHGSFHDYEGFSLSLDARYIALDAGCSGAAGRFDQLFIIATSTGTVQPVQTGTYLAVDSWLPDGRLLCNDLSNPGQATSYLVTPEGDVSELGTGEATWSGGGVTW